MSTATTSVLAPAAPSNTPLIAILTGLAQIALGVGLSIKARADGMMWETAAIPAYVGVIFVVLGALARTPNLRKHLMHAAAALALLLALAGFGMGVPKIVRAATGALPPSAPNYRPTAWWGQVAMATIFVVFLVFAVRSFIAAKRWREANAAA
jgi:hypothetical protein